MDNDSKNLLENGNREKRILKKKKRKKKVMKVGIRENSPKHSLTEVLTEIFTGLNEELNERTYLHMKAPKNSIQYKCQNNSMY